MNITKLKQTTKTISRSPGVASPGRSAVIITTTTLMMMMMMMIIIIITKERKPPTPKF